MKLNASFDEFESRLRGFMARSLLPDASEAENEAEFNRLALALFELQAAAVPIYGKLCAKRGVAAVKNWREIPALPTTAFKEYEVTSLPEAERMAVFHSSGTTAQRPSRHFHNAKSLALYEASLLPWFLRHFSGQEDGKLDGPGQLPQHWNCLFLTPPPALASHSSLAHMFGVIHANSASGEFTGLVDDQGVWRLDLERTIAALEKAEASGQPVGLLGAAFSFVHLCDHCQELRKRFHLPAGSRAMETGGYKGRSRTLTKEALRRQITRWLGIPESHVLAEYGMSELGSQAYDRAVPGPGGAFRFPPWARALVVSPETGREVGDGEAGLIRIVDLVNVRSVLSVQTEDFATRRGDGFELIGRAAEAEARGCSLQFQ